MSEKKTTTKKTTTTKKVVKKETEAQATETKETKPKATPKPKKLNPDDLITIMNNTTGKLVYHSHRTGLLLILEEYGQEDQIPYSELIIMRNTSPRLISEGHVLILNEDAVRELRLEKMYEHMLDYYGVQEFFTLPPDDIKEKLHKMPKAMVETIGSLAKKKYKDGTLYDARVIRAIEEALQIEILS